MGQPGSTSVWNSPRTSPPRTFTAPISVIAQSFGDPPAVSRSTTTNVTSDSEVPSSSMVACSYRGSAAAARTAGWGWPTGTGWAGESDACRPGEEGTGRTVGRGSDSPGDARREDGGGGPRGRRRLPPGARGSPAGRTPATGPEVSV